MLTALLALLSVLCAGLPMLGALAALWWLDRYDREPVWLLVLVFAWGAVGAVSLAMVGSSIALVPVSLLFGATVATHTGTVLIAPLVEEPTKALLLPLVARSRFFDNATDGFVYGGAAGLGFAMTENFLYFMSTAAEGDIGTWFGTVLIRTFFSAMMHATATALVGACLGWGVFRGRLATAAGGAVGLLLGMTIHGVWNGLITAEQLLGADGVLFGTNLLVLPAEIAVAFCVFQVCLWEEGRTIRRELQEEAALGTLPAQHVGILASSWRRQRRGWLPAGIPRARYVRDATTLAFRRAQARRLQGPRHAACAREIVELRARLAAANR
ncbi:MAG: PrsW family intramembrane metalloprotease [Pseudomonadota bacterium]